MHAFKVTYRTVNHPRSSQTGAHYFTTDAEARKFMRRLSWWRQAHLHAPRSGGRRGPT